jgi:hypothetical protein
MFKNLKKSLQLPKLSTFIALKQALGKSIEAVHLKESWILIVAKKKERKLAHSFLHIIGFKRRMCCLFVRKKIHI